jgi:tRNA-specific 2-thiouridylase
VKPSVSKGKVLVAMSGGVDSSVAAALLVREGYEVVGCFMRLGSPGEELEAIQTFEEAESAACDPRKVKIGHQGCCSVGDAADARLVAAELGAPFYVCNFKKDFGRIIDYFVDEYASGRTPNPCVRCNDWLKFGKLHEYAKTLGCDFVASGHYARVDRSDPSRGPRLLRGVDHDKDQSYVLFGAPRDRLKEMMLPIGGFEKPRVREMAKEFGLPVFDKPDSQEICFVPDNDYASLVEKRRPSEKREGDIVDPEGRVVGKHDGQHRFTIGQRRGVGVALGYPIYVVNKDARTNTVTVGPGEMLEATSCAAREVNWLGDEARFADWRECLVKIRYNAAPVKARCRVSVAHDLLKIEFAEPQRAVAPGQAAVCYDAADPEVVLGGGWISEAR